MNVKYCSICSTSFDRDIEGDAGTIGMIPFAFCGTCRAGVVEYVGRRNESRRLPTAKSRSVRAVKPMGVRCAFCNDPITGVQSVLRNGKRYCDAFCADSDSDGVDYSLSP